MRERSQGGNRNQSGEQTAGRLPVEQSQRLSDLLRPVVQNHGLYLEGVDVKIAGAHRTVAVIVDLPEDQTGGVGLNLIAEVSRGLADALDQDPGDDGQPYSLEVSSPGVSRPLTEHRHWRRSLNRMVSVRTTDGRDLSGRVLKVEDDGVLILPQMPVKKGVKPKQGEEVHLPFDDIRKASVDIEFAHPEDGHVIGTSPAAEEA
ncbi:ribosome maturation factor RimP [Arthrobacter roseus]|uniref:ribosome maturation factor RimP n=1 Tax=Arthrobacter roseus TaxID=136274 RepID=UPI0019655D0A|nr:ribosome maturation factor RimP [Arthrobacter roseus]MBM7848210.1 ribosome maturation factor RimP [Arthrobacter roseus]